MRDFSDLPKIVLVLMRIMCLFLTAIMVLIMVVIYWLRTFVEKVPLTSSEASSIILLAALSALALGLAYFMKREIKKME